VKVLLDECIDWRLGRDIVGHEVKAIHQMGWAGTKNGALLALASAQFDAFVTADRNLSFSRIAARCRYRSSCFMPDRTASPTSSLSSPSSCVHSPPLSRIAWSISAADDDV
jgi:hypothetical protein